MINKQLKLPFATSSNGRQVDPYIEILTRCLSEDLSFINETTDNHAHSIHSFPAKFPPQLPRKFINELTQIGDIVLDPMSGSGTTILEALLNDRRAIGFDIDPLALLITRSKVVTIDINKALLINKQIIEFAQNKVLHYKKKLDQELSDRWDKKTKEFLDYWFAKETQRELLSIIQEISKIDDPQLRDFFLLNFSSIIITKSGGVSMAFDLGHTRPHRAKTVVTHSITF